MEISISAWVVLLGFAGGLLLGVAARWGRFCTLGAVEDALYGNDDRRLRSWGVAIAVALLGVHALWWLGVIDLGESFYLAAPFGLVGIIVGGLLFGLGMALAGTCAYGMLARFGGGDLRALIVVIVIAVAAYATLAGILGPLRIAIFEPLTVSLGAAETQHLGVLLSGMTGLPLEQASVIVVALALLYWSFRSRRFRASAKNWIAGLLVGLTITGGWVTTGYLGPGSFDPVTLQSHSFVAPTGRAVLYIMTFTGATLDFGIAAVFGVVVGAWVTAKLQHRFQWEACDDVRELRRNITGGALMGIGGVLALGCSVGQGLSAASSFALSAPIAIVAIYCGARLGLVYLVEGRIGLPFLERIQS